MPISITFNTSYAYKQFIIYIKNIILSITLRKIFSYSLV